MAFSHSDVGEVAAMIVAAGRGTRMGRTDQPKKQFRLVKGKSLLLRVIETFERTAGIDLIVIVTTAEDKHELEQSLATRGKIKAIVTGGETRQQSVAQGLEAIPDRARWVVVHDAARPLVTPDLIERVVNEAKASGAATAGLPVSDTIKRVATDGEVLETLNRSELWAVQTPQAFTRELLLQAHREGPEGVTDDAALVEALGHKVRVVEGSPKNIKVTTQADLDIVAAWLHEEPQDEPTHPTSSPESTWEVVTGFGFDVHRLVPGRPLIIGGIHVDHTHGLAGHSDADVLAHAITDALLGAAALGDIGTHFPDTDPRYKGADSIELLRAAHRLLTESGCAVVHVDAFVSAEAPRLKEVIPSMRARLSEALGLDTSRVSVKAGTGEGAGPVGRAEVIEARAVATVRRRF